MTKNGPAAVSTPAPAAEDDAEAERLRSSALRAAFKNFPDSLAVSGDSHVYLKPYLVAIVERIKAAIGEDPKYDPQTFTDIASMAIISEDVSSFTRVLVSLSYDYLHTCL
jgi:hypothetical protein